MASKKTTSRQRRDAWRKQNAESERLGNAVSIDFVRGIRALKRGVSGAEVAVAVSTGKTDAIMRTLGFDKIGVDGLDKMMGTLGRAGAQASKDAAKAIGRDTRLRYDAINPNIERYITERTGELITTLQDGTLEAVRAATRRTFTGAITPAQAATQIRGSIGLNARQSQALANYRQSLSEGPNAVSPARAQKLGSEYEERLLDQRAIMIGRTETRFAQNAAQQDVWEQGQKDGLLPDTARRVWVVDGNPCPICLPMDGVAVKLDEPWIIHVGGKRKAVDSPSESHPNCFCISTLSFGEA